MGDFLTANRKNDAVVSVCQDNEHNTILISALNSAAERLLKYKKEALLNKPLTNILSTLVVDHIKHNLEYTESGHDLLDVLSRIINFSLIDSTGKSFYAKIKVFRTLQLTPNKINYELLIRDISMSHKLRVFRTEYLKGTRHKNHNLFGILNHDSTVLELQIVLNFALKHQMNLIIGMIGLEEANSTLTIETLKVIIEHFYKNCRADDLIGYTCENKILFILLDCDTHHVIERIYYATNTQLQKRKLPNASIAYSLQNSNSVEPDSVKLIEQLKTSLLQIDQGFFKVD
ncbi:hypothetical protein BIY23_03470 [Wolbachia pipientis]|uniref:Uncharacterized protein n=1 Tax=Wolbachia pipientis TaxID=955 RepID=A0A1E7QK33_WOLPI|nr:PAS domain-containing protein [Wolbachia pipientis]OEY86589.1 hypothetical protein BIY23_03470 [Wolbachia pipientis]